MEDILKSSATKIAENIKNGLWSSNQVSKVFLDYAKACSDINAFTSISEDNILKASEAVDRKIKENKEVGPLAGVPFVIKDNIMVSGEKMTCSSRALKDYVSTYDATVVKKIKEADGIIFGKSNMDEFAMGSSTEYSIFGPTKNPWNKATVPGGSSGGSAAAVASMMAPVALGSDTGGSIRQPAAFCGIYGLKPTYGRISRRGIVSFASSLDQIGPFARDINDIALAMNILSGYDEKDSTSSNSSVPDFRNNLNMDIKDLKIAILSDELVDQISPDIKASYLKTKDQLIELGAKVEEVKIDYLSHAIEAYYIIAPAEVSSNLSRIDGIRYGLSLENAKTFDDIYSYSRTNGFGDEVKRRIMIGNYVLSSGHYDSYFKKAYRVRRLVRNQFDKLFSNFDVLLSPTTPTKAFEIGSKFSDPVDMYLSDIFTVSSNLTGMPSISIPIEISEGLPIGLQLTSNIFREDILIKVASALSKFKNIDYRRSDV
jgi:aspartyl-tRNA(Asn)/glutamyl-tRNA(Gln) amidotransferase subunit A